MRDLAADHLNPAVTIGGNGIRPLGMLGRKLGHTHVERLATVERRIPIVRTYIVYKPLAALRITEIVVIQITGIPIHQHPAVVEYYISYHITILDFIRL